MIYRDVAAAITLAVCRRAASHSERKDFMRRGSTLLRLMVVMTVLVFAERAHALDRTIIVSASFSSATALGVQSTLDSIAASGGGSLTLTGPGSLLVENTLTVGSNVSLQGDPARTPYGMVLFGANSPSCSYRANCYDAAVASCPTAASSCGALVEVDSANSASSPSTTTTIWNLDFEGEPPSSPSPAAPVSASNGAIRVQYSNNVLITYNKINAFRRGGISATMVNNSTIEFLSLYMSRHGAANEPEGGSGLWCLTCQNVTVTHSELYAVDYFNSGPPSTDARAYTTPPSTALPITDSRIAPTMDIVGFYDGSYNTFSHNKIAYGNTAAIYLASNCPGCTSGGESNDIIWDNDISYFRQHGLDIDKCANCTFVTNRINTYVEQSNLSLARSAGCVSIEYNTLGHGGNWHGSYGTAYGSINFTGHTHDCTTISDNNIYGSNNPYAIYFDQWSADSSPIDYPYDNILTNNNLWKGTTDYSGGSFPTWATVNQVSNNIFN